MNIMNLTAKLILDDKEYQVKLQEAKKQAGKGAKITTFLSTNENMEIITIYKLTFKALF